MLRRLLVFFATLGAVVKPQSEEQDSLLNAGGELYPLREQQNAGSENAGSELAQRLLQSSSSRKINIGNYNYIVENKNGEVFINETRVNDFSKNLQIFSDVKGFERDGNNYIAVAYTSFGVDGAINNGLSGSGSGACLKIFKVGLLRGSLSDVSGEMILNVATEDLRGNQQNPQTEIGEGGSIVCSWETVNSNSKTSAILEFADGRFYLPGEAPLTTETTPTKNVLTSIITTTETIPTENVLTTTSIITTPAIEVKVTTVTNKITGISETNTVTTDLITKESSTITTWSPSVSTDESLTQIGTSMLQNITTVSTTNTTPTTSNTIISLTNHITGVATITSITTNNNTTESFTNTIVSEISALQELATTETTTEDKTKKSNDSTLVKIGNVSATVTTSTTGKPEVTVICKNHYLI